MSQYEIVVLNSEFEDLRYEEHVMQELGNFRLKKIEAYTPQQTINFIKDADAIINQYGILNKEVIDALNNCKVISSYGVGIDRIDTKTATEKGICVANVPDYCVDEVSDHALTLILNFSRKINFLNNTIKNLAS